MAKVFLTNATGYIGSAVAKNFKAHGHAVSALARSQVAMDTLQSHGVVPVKGDLKQPELFIHAVQSNDVIIHTAATNDAHMSDVDGLAIEAMLSALKGSGKTFIYTSGVWVIGNTGPRPANEEVLLRPASLVAWRAAHEKIVLAYAQQTIKTVVLRPSVVYGNRRGIVDGFVDLARQYGKAFYIANGDNFWSFIHADDLADAYRLAFEKAPAGSRYNIDNGSPVQLKQIAEWVAETAGVAGSVESLDPDRARKMFGPLTEPYMMSQKIDSSKARTDFGWVPNAPKLREYLSSLNLNMASTGA